MLKRKRRNEVVCKVAKVTDKEVILELPKDFEIHAKVELLEVVE